MTWSRLVSEIRIGATGWPKVEWVPRRQVTAGWSRGKLILHLYHPMVRLYGCECFVARRDASLLYVTVAAVPIPPAAEQTKGVKVPCSISLNFCSYYIFVFLFCAYDNRKLSWYDYYLGAKRLKTLTSKTWTGLFKCGMHFAILSNTFRSLVILCDCDTFSATRWQDHGQLTLHTFTSCSAIYFPIASCIPLIWASLQSTTKPSSISCHYVHSNAPNDHPLHGCVVEENSIRDIPWFHCK